MFKEVIADIFTHFKLYSKKQLISVAILPAALIYFEFIFRIFSNKEPFTWISIILSIFSPLALGLLLDMLCSVTKSEKVNGWLVFIVMQLISFWFLIVLFTEMEFDVYMDFKTIFGGGGGIATEASNYVFEIMARNWPIILAYEVPEFIYIVCFLVFKLTCHKRFYALGYIEILIIVAIFEAVAVVPVCNIEIEWEKTTWEYDFNECVKRYNVTTSTKLDVIYSIFSNPWKRGFDLEGSKKVNIYYPESYNMSRIDFDDLINESTNSTVTEIHEYVQTLTPSKKNEYTGMFEGKNLIQITAESFSPQIIDPDLTPTLYKLSKSGIVFEDYYQALWDGSTTTGEFLIMTGLLPSNGYNSMLKTVDKNMYLTIGNQLLRQGYTSLAFHSGTHTYFSRNLTHCNLGYTSYIAKGSGLVGLTGTQAWPQSDLELFQLTTDYYIDSEPFNAYYMSLSGHSKYDQTNWVVRQNIDHVKEWAQSKGYEFSNAVLSYYAANYEFEKGLAWLIQELKDAGVYENTVIVITSDHYPYALSDDYMITDDHKVKYYGVEANLEELYGYKPVNDIDYSHNTLIIWTPTMENTIVISEPVYSIDILPTLSNLFGLEYDSRLLVGQDVFSPDFEGLVIFKNYSWYTSKGYYNSKDRSFTPNEGYEVDEEYIEKMNTIVRNKMVFSQNVTISDYYDVIYGDK